MDKMTRLRQCAIRLVLMPEYPMHEFNVLARLGLRIPDMTDKKMRTLLHPDKNGLSPESTESSQKFAVQGPLRFDLGSLQRRLQEPDMEVQGGGGLRECLVGGGWQA